jgi:hypothetical protein
VILLTVFAGLFAVAQARGRRVFMRETLSYKPAEFSVSGNGDFLVQHARWHSWGGRTATASGQVIEQERPSHINHFYRARITLSQRRYCQNLHRRVYEKVVVQILGPSAGVFGTRTAGNVWSCTSFLRLLP